MAFDFDELTGDDGGGGGMFDFENLESFLPGDLTNILSMNQEGLGRFGERIQTALKTQDYGDLDQSITEALWVQPVPRARIAHVVKELLDLLSTLADGDSDQEFLSGCAAMHALFRFALCPPDETIRTKKSEKGGRVALILGPAGSRAEDLAPQADFYGSKGFTTITMCRCIFPDAFRRYQELQLVRELQEVLSSGTRLLVHLCSRHGHGAWCHMAPHWSRGKQPFHSLPLLQDCLRAVVWECSPPLDPSLESQLDADLQAMAAGGRPSLTLDEALCMQRELHSQFCDDEFLERLMELEETHKMGTPKFLGARNKLFLEVQAPILVKYGFQGSHRGVAQMLQAGARWNDHPDYARNRNRLNTLLGLSAEGSGEHDRRMAAAHREWAAEERKRERARGESETGDAYDEDSTGMARCADACVRSLVARYLPKFDLSALMPKIRAFILGAASRGAFWKGDDYALKTDAGEPLWGVSSDWVAVDAAIKPPVPRLFLFSKDDAVVPSNAVETFIRLVSRYHADAAILVEAGVPGPHMSLWQRDHSRCERTLAALLRKADLQRG
mmetsp:Transcript_12764/g.40014  ORF Transcript_12764/g.40014 Transcript_12764/m.40014 type:complete len:558 (-) Transcript_12764:319-1992(-)